MSQIYTGSFEVEQVKWTYNHDAQTVTNGTLTLNIGDYVNDTETTVTGFDGKWRVLGEENGQLLLVSANYVDFDGSVGPPGTPLKSLSGVDGYNNSISSLNALCMNYENPAKTENSRCINISDVNRITGYKPTETRLDKNDLTIKGIYGKDTVNQYENNVTYVLRDGKVWYKGDKAATTETAGWSGYNGNTGEYTWYTKFKPLDSNTNITEPYTIKGTYYTYFPQTLGTFPESSVTNGQILEGIETDSIMYDMLFKTQSSIPYWLASNCVQAAGGVVYWSLFIVAPPGVISSGSLWGSRDGAMSQAYGVRPVVSLKSNIMPAFVSKDDTTHISTYEI